MSNPVEAPERKYSPDEKGRPGVGAMSDRQLLEEVVTTQRSLADLVEGFMSSMDSNPMMRMMAKGMGMGK
jgi:hypothetical protein